MRHVFEASNMLEAHVVNGVLQAEGIHGFIEGEYLQGGLGDIPVAGTVRLAVNDGDFERARQIIRQWEAEQSDVPEADATARGNAWGYPFVLGFCLGILVAAWLF